MAGGLEGLMKQIVAAFSGGGSGGGASSSKQQIIDHLKDKGYSKEAIAGIVGNIDVETGGSFDYKQKELNAKGKPKKDGAEGLFQFDFMKPHYETWRKNNKKKDSIESQIDFMDEVVKGKVDMLGTQERAILGEFLFKPGHGRAEDIAGVFTSVFEKPEKGKEHFDRRKASAIDIYKTL